MSIITVASIERKEKRSIITTTEGKKIGVWQNQIHIFTNGGTYDVELSEKEVNGTVYTNVSKAKLVTQPAAANAEQAPKLAQRETSDRDAERMFVCAQLSALIRAGEVHCDKTELWEATNLLRSLWRHTFGPSGQLHATISQRAMIERDVKRDTPPSRAYKDSGSPIDSFPDWNENPAAGMQAAE